MADRFYLGDENVKLYLGDHPISTGGGTIIPKTITANGTYNASADSADGYSPVTVNVPSPTASSVVFGANLTDKDSGSLDLTNGWSADTSALVTETITIDNVARTGLRVPTTATITTSKNFDTALNKLAFEFYILQVTQATTRLLSTGGYDFKGTIWYDTNSPYLRYVFGWFGTSVLDSNLISDGDGNYHDPAMVLDDLVNVVTSVTYEKMTDDFGRPATRMLVNGVPKIMWSEGVLENHLKEYPMHFGANGVSGTDCLLTKCEWSAEGISYNGHRYALVD